MTSGSPEAPETGPQAHSDPERANAESSDRERQDAERKVVEKAPDAYRTISEVAEALDVPQHVLRFWETKFTQVKPLKRAGGRRYYRPDDVVLLQGIRQLLYGEGYTLRGVQRILREKGVRSVKAIGEGQERALDGTASAAVESAAPSPSRPVAAPEASPPAAPDADAVPTSSAAETMEEAAEPVPETPPSTAAALSGAARDRLAEALRALDRAEALLSSHRRERDD